MALFTTGHTHRVWFEMGTAVTEVSMVDVESAIEARRHRVLVQSLILGLPLPRFSPYSWACW